MNRLDEIRAKYGGMDPDVDALANTVEDLQGRLKRNHDDVRRACERAEDAFRQRDIALSRVRDLTDALTDAEAALDEEVAHYLTDDEAPPATHKAIARARAVLAGGDEPGGGSGE